MRVPGKSVRKTGKYRIVLGGTSYGEKNVFIRLRVTGTVKKSSRVKIQKKKTVFTHHI
jgi:hypothetical protein